MSNRLSSKNMTIYRRSADVARYVSLAHDARRQSSKTNLNLLANWKGRHQKDGLNSLVYEKLQISFHKLYTWIKAELKQGK
uniref:Beta-1,4-galactosyltransferase 3 n=1 Tax=Rhipicephalus appendiculatus TaxID=34631 RepID=A0A131Z3V0_RHIAP